MPSFVEIGEKSGENDENVKSLQTDGQTDRRRTTGDQKSSLELSAQVSLKQVVTAPLQNARQQM